MTYHTVYVQKTLFCVCVCWEIEYNSTNPDRQALTAIYACPLVLAPPFQNQANQDGG